MDLIIKLAAAALSACIIGLLLKKTNPELAILLSICAVTMILIAAAGFLAGLAELAHLVKTIAGSSDTLTGPVLKCLGIAVISRISGELCRESSQPAVAVAVEMAGTVCAFSVALPLMTSMLKMIGGMI